MNFPVRESFGSTACGWAVRHEIYDERNNLTLGYAATVINAAQLAKFRAKARRHLRAEMKRRGIKPKWLRPLWPIDGRKPDFA